MRPIFRRLAFVSSLHKLCFEMDFSCYFVHFALPGLPKTCSVYKWASFAMFASPFSLSFTHFSVRSSFGEHIRFVNRRQFTRDVLCSLRPRYPLKCSLNQNELMSKHFRLAQCFAALSVQWKLFIDARSEHTFDISSLFFSSHSSQTSHNFWPMQKVTNLKQCFSSVFGSQFLASFLSLSSLFQRVLFAPCSRTAFFITNFEIEVNDVINCALIASHFSVKLSIRHWL